MDLDDLGIVRICPVAQLCSNLYSLVKDRNEISKIEQVGKICVFIKDKVMNLDHDVNELLFGGQLEVCELLSPLLLPLTKL